MSKLLSKAIIENIVKYDKKFTEKQAYLLTDIYSRTVMITDKTTKKDDIRILCKTYNSVMRIGHNRKVIL